MAVTEYHGHKEVIWTSLTMVAVVVSLSLCAGLFIYFKRYPSQVNQIIVENED